MDVHKEKIVRLHVKKAMANLEKNNYGVSYVPDREGVVSLLSSLIPEGSVIGSGGSVTLNETGVIELVKNGNYTYLDRYEAGISREESMARTRKHVDADIYLSSANAVTEHGELYCVDGSNNRLAALLFGPKKVYVVVGVNKLVRNLREAALRVKQVAAPANAVRLSKDTHCSLKGACMAPDFSDDNLMVTPPGACPEGICSSYLVLGHQKFAQRIHVIIVGEELGY